MELESVLDELFGAELPVSAVPHAGLPDSETPRPLNVPNDIWQLVMACLDDWRSMAAIATTCRAAYRVYENVIRATRARLGCVRLGLMQAAIRDEALQMPEAGPHETNYYEVRAPMGFGKTIVGLSIAFADPCAGSAARYLFLVPPKAYDTWVREACRVFGQSTSKVTPETCVLFAHSSVPAHYRAYRAWRASGQKPGPVRAIVASSLNIGDFRAEMLARLRLTRAIVDEAHTLTRYVALGLSALRWVVLLSANAIKPFKDLAFRRAGGFTVAPGYLDGKVPPVAVRLVTVEPCASSAFNEATQFVLPEAKRPLIEGNLEAYLDALGALLAEIGSGRVALYLPDGAAGDLIEEGLHGATGGWDCVVFRRAVSKIQRFHGLDRVILLIRLAMSEAINILATHLVIVRPDWVNPTRYAQIVGRVLRPANTSERVALYVVVPRGAAGHRAVYYEARRRLAEAGVPLPLVDYRPAEYERADTCLRLCGSSLATAAPAEAAAAMGDAYGEPGTAAKLASHWQGDARKTVTRDQMWVLLGRGPGE
jgi:hypothetical protein